jgi:hypothetical protein
LTELTAAIDFDDGWAAGSVAFFAIVTMPGESATLIGSPTGEATTAVSCVDKCDFQMDVSVKPQGAEIRLARKMIETTRKDLERDCFFFIMFPFAVNEWLSLVLALAVASCASERGRISRPCSYL